jgi:hypothetical protein
LKAESALLADFLLNLVDLLLPLEPGEKKTHSANWKQRMQMAAL